MRTATMAVTAVVLLGLAACGQGGATDGRTQLPPAGTSTASSTSGSSASSVAPTGSSSEPATGTLTGVVRLYGGPMNPTTGKMALNGAPSPDWTVTVLRGTETVATTTSGADGRFAVDVPPGSYTLDCSGAPTFDVVAGGTVAVDCARDVP